MKPLWCDARLSVLLSFFSTASSNLVQNVRDLFVRPETSRTSTSSLCVHVSPAYSAVQQICLDSYYNGGV